MARPGSAGGPGDAAGPIALRLAEDLAGPGGPARQRAAGWLRELGAVDQSIYAAVAATPTPSLDEPLRRLSDAANHSRLWLATAAGLAVAGGAGGRRAAVRGTLAIAVTSALVNLAVKALWSRPRPDRAGAGVPRQRNVRMPASTSFPSGHAASGFAFASAIGQDQPSLGLALRFLAAAVAYSRVHTGVHYPGDVVAGALIGEAPGRRWPACWTGCRPPGGQAGMRGASCRRIPQARRANRVRAVVGSCREPENRI